MRFKYLPIFAVLFLAWPAIVFAAEREVEVFRFEEEDEQNPAKELWEKGEIAIRERMFDSAIKYFEEFLKILDKSETDYEQQFIKATEFIVKSHLMMKNADAALLRLGQSFNGSAVYSLTKELTYSLAQALVLKEEWAKAAATLAPLTSNETPSELRLQAVILASDCMMKLGEWRHLAETIENYLAEDGNPQNFELIYRLSEAYVALGENQKAEAVIAKLAELKMDADNELKFNILCTRNLAIMGKADEAFANYDKISTRMPDSPDNDWWLMLTALADALYNENSLDNAFKMYENVIKMSSTMEQMMHANQYLFLISIKQNRKNDDLIKRVDEFQSNYPSSKELIEMVDILARHLQKKGENGAAAEQFIRLTNLIPDAKTTYQAFFNAGECFAAFGNFESAISAFLSANARGLDDDGKAIAMFRAAEIAKYLFKGASPAEANTAATRAIGYFKDVADKYPGSPQAPQARFFQAELLEKTRQYKEAASVYGLLGTAYPKDPQFEESVFRRGICMRLGAVNADEKLDAARFLSDGAKSMESLSLSNDAHIEAFRAFREANALKEAEMELNFVVDAPAALEKRREALFRRAMLRYETGDITGARKDTDTMRSEFKDDKYTNELCIFTGDSYANEQDWANARKYYSEPTNDKHDENIRPYALYESANASYRLGDYAQAINYAKGLIGIFNEETNLTPESKSLLARTYYLMGDAYVSMPSPQYQDAQECYGKCCDYAQDKDLKFASFGRRGDVFLQMASQNQRLLQNDNDGKNLFDEAIKYYEEIIKNYPMDHPLGLMARYKKAKTLKNAKDFDNALKEYKEFYASFEQRNGKHNSLDTFYFASAVYEMAEILEGKGDEDSLNDAKRFYVKLAETNHPSAGTARERVKTIRNKLDEIKRKKQK